MHVTRVCRRAAPSSLLQCCGAAAPAAGATAGIGLQTVGQDRYKNRLSCLFRYLSAMHASSLLGAIPLVRQYKSRPISPMEFLPGCLRALLLPDCGPYVKFMCFVPAAEMKPPVGPRVDIDSKIFLNANTDHLK